jgi:peptidoglycan DL-endopeptidase CwlO
MSLEALVHEVGQALGDARRLFGSAPVPGGWGAGGGLGSGRNAVSQANGAAAQTWSGAGGSNYVATGRGQVTALDSVISADKGTTAGLGGSADASARGRAGMDAVVDDTRAGVAAIAPSTDTPVGRQQLVTHLQSQLQRAKVLLQVSEQRNIALAGMIRNAAAGYRAGGAAMMSGAPAMGAPAMMPGAGAGALALPALARLTTLTHHRPDARLPPHTPRTAIGGGPAAQVAAKAALSRLGCPYVWGAKGPDAFDCSGLVRWSYAQAGVTLGDDTYTQFQQGMPVAPGDVQAGDMVFPNSSFGERGRHPRPGHVMMAISPTECVEAQQRGIPVKISPMPSGFLARRPTTA